ncbi:MAG: cysteine desulfurase family protein [Bacteroidota bacterium]
MYLDHAATTPLDPRVLEVMMPYLTDQFGNASSPHGRGRRARFAVEEARERIAMRIGAEPGEIVFTSGATESNNTALALARGKGLVTTLAEHEATLEPAKAMQEAGDTEVILLDPGAKGFVTADDVAAVLTDRTALVSVMHVNNETGAVSPIRAIADVARTRAVLMHTDAVQSMGYLAPNVDNLGVDLLSISSHKLYGPKGIGVLFVRAGIELPAFVRGGAQERRRRGGTENVASIVGMAEAVDLAYRERDDRLAHVGTLRDRLRAGLDEALDTAYTFNTPFDEGAAPHVVNLSFPPVDGRPMDGEMLILNLDVAGIQASSGSACTSGAIEPSHVLLAMGHDRETASAALRFSLGKDTTEAEIDQAVEVVKKVVERMRG